MPSPLWTATAQAVCLSAASNVIAQFIEAYQAQRPVQLDFPQLLRFLTLSIITTPPNYQWQQLLERSFPAYPRKAPDASMKDHDVEKRGDTPAGPNDPETARPLNLRNTFTKWFVDCITLGAIMNTAAFLILMGLMKRQDFATIKLNLKTEMIPIIVAGWKIWPVASFISFSFVPVEKRIVFLSFIGLLWGIYMSLVAAKI